MPKRKLANDNNTNSIKKSIKKKSIKKKKINKVKSANKIESLNKIKSTNKIESLNKVKSSNKVKSANKVESLNKIKSANKVKSITKINKSNKLSNNSSNNSSTTNDHVMFNKILINALKNKNIFKTNLTTISNKAKFKSIEEYQNDFNDIISFRKGLTKKDVEELNMIVYHDENNDGIFSASIAYHFLKTEGTNKNNISLLGTKPIRSINPFITNPEQYKGKNVLILDLDYNGEYLQLLSRYCNSILVIDDHDKKDQRNSDKIKLFKNRANIHGTVAYVWKFFYPKLDVPLAIQLIDDSDIKLFLPFIPRGYSNNFTQAIGHRYVHNKSPELIAKKRSGKLFEELWDFINEKSIDYLIFAGYYYQEVLESLKDQIAINAKPANFQGYDVAVLNFNAPNLKKQVMRQIMSNYRAMGNPIKFCVLWGYEYTNNCYDVTIMDDHRPSSTINLKEIAEELGRIGGTAKGGGGHQHEAHFYWPRNDKMDIWDLFSQKFIRN